MTFSRIISLLSILFFFGCSVSYNFTGSSVPENASKIHISQITNESNGGPATMSQTFTEELRDYFQQNTKLSIEKKPIANELSLEGSIVKYDVQPVAPKTDGVTESASVNRLTISLKMDYTNPFSPDDDFNEVISFYQDYPAEQSLTEVEDALIEDISQQLILKIFNRCFGNW